MPINNMTYNPLLTFTFTATEDLPANRFISFSGALNGASEQSIGVTEIAWNSGDVASAITQGIAIIETADDLFAGDDVCTGTDGKAVGQTGTNPVIGKALDDCSSGEYIRILLRH